MENGYSNWFKLNSFHLTRRSHRKQFLFQKPYFCFSWLKENWIHVSISYRIVLWTKTQVTSHLITVAIVTANRNISKWNKNISKPWPVAHSDNSKLALWNYLQLQIIQSQMCFKKKRKFNSSPLQAYITIHILHLFS